MTRMENQNGYIREYICFGINMKMLEKKLNK